MQLFTDAAGSAACGAGCIFNKQWSFFEWPKHWENSNILKDLSFLEMVPVLLAIHLWGNQMRNKNISFMIDNEGLVAVLNQQTSKSKRLMQLIRPFILFAMQLNMTFKAFHLPSHANKVADSISRCKWALFRELAPYAEPLPMPIPESFRRTICAVGLTDC